MKNLLAVILIALCAIVFNSNKSQAQSDENLPSWVVTVHGEGGVGVISGAYVTIYDNNNSVVFNTKITGGNGVVDWSITTGFPSGNYRIHLDPYGSHGESNKTISYTNGPVVENINIGPVL